MVISFTLTSVSAKNILSTYRACEEIEWKLLKTYVFSSTIFHEDIRHCIKKQEDRKSMINNC